MDSLTPKCHQRHRKKALRNFQKFISHVRYRRLFDCYFSARPRTSGLNRKLSVLYLLKAKNESFLTNTYVNEPIEFKNDCNFLVRLRTSGLYRKLSVLYRLTHTGSNFFAPVWSDDLIRYYF